MIAVLRQLVHELHVANLLKARESMIKGSLEWQRVTDLIEKEMGR